MSCFRISASRRRSGMSQKVIYQLFLRTFTPEGTIRAATERLSHIASLGVDIVYLVSFCEADDHPDRSYWSPRQLASGIDNPRNPYRIMNYEHIDPEYGTHEDFRIFVKTAHALGLLVMTDLVYMHCGPGRFAETHPDFLKKNADGSICYNSYHFPDLDFSNPVLCEYLWQNMEFWVREFDIDGYRCDVGDAVPIFFWREGRRRVECIKKPFLMLNEGERADYLLDVFDASYDLLWGKAIRKTIRGEWMSHDLRCADVGMRAKMPGGGLVIRSYENHDYTNDSYEQRMDRIAYEYATAANVVNFTVSGIPLLYNGNEFADARRHSMWRLAGDEFCIDWSRINDACATARMALIRRLCELRHTEPTLCDGKTVWYKHPRLTLYRRERGQDRILVVANFEREDVSMPCPIGASLLEGGIRTEEGSLILSPGGYLVLREGGDRR